MGSVTEFNYLFDALADLHAQLRECRLSSECYVAEIAGVPADKEQLMQDGLLKLDVKHHMNDKAVRVAKRAWQEYLAVDGLSTKYVKRYAGFVVCRSEAAISLIREINSLKDQLKDCVREPFELPDGSIAHRRNHVQKHEFIHDAIPRIMTTQLYRHIPLIEAPVKSLSFSWTQKSAPIRMNREEALAYIGRNYGSEDISRDRTSVLRAIETSPYQVFEKPRVHNAIVIISRYDGTGTANIQATTPIVITQPLDKIKFKPVKEHTPKAKAKIKSTRVNQLICERTGVRAVEGVLKREKDNG